MLTYFPVSFLFPIKKKVRVRVRVRVRDRYPRRWRYRHSWMCARKTPVTRRLPRARYVLDTEFGFDDLHVRHSSLHVAHSRPVNDNVWRHTFDISHLRPELVMGHFFKTQPNPTQNFWTQPNQ